MEYPGPIVSRRLRGSRLKKGKYHDEKSIGLHGVPGSGPLAAFSGGQQRIEIQGRHRPCVTGSPVTVNLNIVRGVQPAGQIWVINQLDAKVGSDGSITVDTVITVKGVF
jgi:hypothetical protein